MGSLTLDELDRKLAHALQIDGRAPLSRIAEVLDVSDRTLARRYRRLRSAGVVRVVGVPDDRRLGRTRWLLRSRCTPSAARSIAAALARRIDTSWVCLTSGGTEVTCVVSAVSRDVPLVGVLAETPGTVGVTAYCLLRSVAGTAGWRGRTNALSPGQVEELRRSAPSGHDERDALAVTDADRLLLPVLAVDGRAGYPGLAAATGWSASTVRRRLDLLRHTGALSFTVQTDARLFGCTAEAVLWLTVAPAQLAAVGDVLGTHPQIAYAAATTGPANIVAVAVCRDPNALYDYLATGVGTLPGVHGVETAPINRYLKRAGPLLPRPAVT